MRNKNYKIQFFDNFNNIYRKFYKYKRELFYKILL